MGYSTRIVKECAGCMKIQGKICKVILTPNKMWKDGKCWSRTEDPEWEEKVNAAIKAYECGK